MICLFSGTTKFTKRASNVSIAASNVRIDTYAKNDNAIDKCLKQKFTSIGVLINPECSQFEESLYYVSIWVIVENETVIELEIHKTKRKPTICNKTSIFDLIETDRPGGV